MGVAALLAYFVSTPYAFLDKYYFYSMSVTWKLVSKGRVGEVNFLTWLTALRSYWGDVRGMSISSLTGGCHM